ncbi:DUF4129 domain-containing protein [Bizionia sp. KMM 8389]
MMSKTVKHNIVIMSCLLCKQTISLAQNAIQKDTTHISVTYFKDGIKERYSGRDFNYSVDDTGGINLIQQLLQKFFGWLESIFGIKLDFIDYKTLEYIVYTILFAAALYLFIKFMMESPISTVFKTEEKSIDNFSYVEEDIQRVDFDNLISSALEDENYRLATRYLYLKTLKLLTNKNIIDWHYDKTNSDYLSEITDTDIKQEFERISYIYDYVWYGEFSINRDIFSKNQIHFNSLNNQING